MRVLVACEFSGIVRDAFIARGHDAWSCDLLETENQGNHITANVLGELDYPPPMLYGEFATCDQYFFAPRPRWELMIAHPPCTHLAVSGARWFKNKINEQKDAIKFVEALWLSSIPKICIENPISIISTRSILGKPTQIIQPWQFGHGETKATCLWLKNLPPLVPTNIVSGREHRVHCASPGPDRWKERSRTLPGIAAAMAAQWGSL